MHMQYCEHPSSHVHPQAAAHCTRSFSTPTCRYSTTCVSWLVASLMPACTARRSVRWSWAAAMMEGMSCITAQTAALVSIDALARWACSVGTTAHMDVHAVTACANTTQGADMIGVQSYTIHHANTW